MSQVKKTTTCPDLVDERIKMLRIRGALDLDLIPVPYTLYKTFDRLEMALTGAAERSTRQLTAERCHRMHSESNGLMSQLTTGSERISPFNS